MKTNTSSVPIVILSVAISSVPMSQLLIEIKQIISEKQKAWIATPNPEILLKAHYDTQYADTLNHSDYAIPDGIGVRIAAQYIKETRALKKQSAIKNIVRWSRLCLTAITNQNQLTVVPEQIAGDELFGQLINIAHQQKYKVFLLGAGPGIAQKAAQSLRRAYPNLQIGYDRGLRQASDLDSEENLKIIDKINQFQPHILFVAYGAPNQERWIDKYLPNLNIKLAMGVGGTLDQVAGRVPIEPKWMRRYGVRWLGRLITQPHRLMRILNAVIVFPYVVIQSHYVDTTSQPKAS